jgi:AraC-like DNA-binding protein
MSTIPPKQLVRLLRSQVIPWTAPGSTNGIFVARKKIDSLEVPEGITISRRKIKGKRVAIKKPRWHDMRFFAAVWPDDNLQEITVPKLVCIISGEADYLVGNYCAHCTPGTFMLMPPLVPHQQYAPNLQGERLKNGSCTLVHVVAFRHGIQFWYSRSVKDQSINEYTDNYLISSVSAARMMDLLMEEAAEEKPHFKAIAAGLIAALFALIAREIEAGNYIHPGPKENVPETDRHTATFAEQVREYVETHCHKRLQIDDAAVHMYMSRSQFTHRMRREMGVTFVELLTRVRIEQACKMLRETKFSCITIANCLGFRSSTYFQALFRSRMGCTPIEYRRRHTLKN